MAAGDPIAITNSRISALNATQALTQVAADAVAAATAQKFVYTPTGKDNKVCFVVYNGAALGLTATLSAGAGVFGTAAKANTIPATAGTYIVQVETGRHTLANGTIELSVLPGAGKALLTDHSLTVGAIELQ
jgi:hypothetical protein